MASIQKRGKNSYRLIVELGYDAKGKRIRKTKTVKCRTKGEAKEELAKFIVEVKSGEYIEPEKMSLGDFVKNEWLPKFAKTNYKPSTLESYTINLNAHILPRFGDMYLDQIKTMHIVNFLDDLKKPEARKDGKDEPYSNSHILNLYRCLKSIFKYARKWEFIAKNPMDGVDSPKQAKLSTDYYETEEVEQIIQALYENEPLNWRMYFLAALLGGFRRGELLALEWQDVDFENNTFTIRKSISATENGKALETDTTKNEVVRVVDMPEWYMDELKLFQLEWKKEYMQVRDIWGMGDRQYIWHGGTGKPYYHSTPTHRWRKFIKRNGFRYVSLHGLRHTAATILVESNTSMKAIQARLGHKKQSTTQDIYAHVTKKLNRETAKQYDRFNPKNKIGHQSVTK